MSGRRSISENLDTVFEYMEEGNEEDGLDLLEELLDNGMSPETMSDWKLLQYAIAIDNPDMVQILIEHNVDPFRIDDGEGMPLEMALREGRYEIAELLKDYITVIMIQRNRRRNIKNKKIKTLRNRLIRNKQKLITAKHPDLDFDTSRILGETLHNMPVNPEVYTRMNQERRAEEERVACHHRCDEPAQGATIRRRQMENTRMANYLDTLEQFGGNGENDDEIKNVDKIIKEVTDEEKLKSLIRIAKAQISHIRDQRENQRIINNPNQIPIENQYNILDRINPQ